MERVEEEKVINEIIRQIKKAYKEKEWSGKIVCPRCGAPLNYDWNIRSDGQFDDQVYTGRIMASYQKYNYKKCDFYFWREKPEVLAA